MADNKKPKFKNLGSTIGGITSTPKPRPKPRPKKEPKK